MLITEFFRNKELFITGGTGFLGKSLIEKLLRDCPDISKIYLLIRAKRNKTPLERMKEFSQDLVFERLHRERPNAFQKVIPITGDSSELGLAISAEDLERLKNVNIIIHGAANVRFDNILRMSILMNTRGTYELLKIAVTLKKLIAFIHVSTAYIAPYKFYIKEELIEALVNWRTAIKIAETFADQELEILQNKYTHLSNSYSLSKNLAENVVAEFADKLPITILRPSVVAPSINEPEPGFVDNINGPIALSISSATGMGQILFCNPKLVLAVIPVDTVTLCTIIAAYRRGLETLNSKKLGLDICNLTPGNLYELTAEQNMKQFVKHAHKEPFENTLWAPRAVLTNKFFVFIMSVFLINIPLAIIYDALLALNRRERMVLKMTRKYVFGSKALKQFSQLHYDFENDGMWELIKIIPEKEKEIFHDDFVTLRYDMDTVCQHARDGIKKFIFKQPVKASAATHRHFKILRILDNVVKVLFFLIITIVLWRMLN